MTGTSRIDGTIALAPSQDAGASPALVPGQRVIGRVLNVLASSQFLLAVGGERFVAQSALPLTAGQQIALEVMKAGATLEMRLLAPEAQATPARDSDSEHTLTLAALVNGVKAGQVGRAAVDGRLFMGAVDALMKSIQRTGTTDVDALARTLTPQSTEGDPAALAERLRAAFENGGQLFEAHLRSVFDAHPELSDQEALERVRADARALIGRAAGGIADLDDPDAAAGRMKLDAVAAQMLGRQVQSALHWVADGALTFKLPVRLPSGDAEAEITFRREPDGADAEAHAPGFNVRFRVNSDVIGVVDASASWRGPALRTTISVVTADAQELLQPELSTLERGLRAMFASVQALVVVDPGRVHEGHVKESVPHLPGGSLLNVRA